MTNSVAGVILAAGMGTRMRSELIKVLHPLGGEPMLTYPIQALREAGVTRIVVVVGHQADRVKASIGDGVEYVVQSEQLGTAHAVQQSADALRGFAGAVVVTYGDTPLYRPETYRRLVQEHVTQGAAASVLSTVVADPRGYGRIVRNAEGGFDRIVEQRDIHSPATEEIREINTGTYCFTAPELYSALQDVRNDNDQGEYYLPDALVVLRERGRRVHISTLSDDVEAMGINDRVQLARAELEIKRRTLRRLMEAGVTIIDPESVYIHPSVEIGRDSVIHPFTTIEGRTRVGQRCEIGPHVRLLDAHVGDGAVVVASHVVRSTVEADARVGPAVYRGDATTQISEVTW